MNYAIVTIELEISRIIKALRIMEATPFTAFDCENGLLPDMGELKQNLQDLRLAKKVLENTDVGEANRKYYPIGYKENS